MEMVQHALIENQNLQEVILSGQQEKTAYFITTPKMTSDTKGYPEKSEFYNNPFLPPPSSIHCGCTAGASSLICVPRSIVSTSSTLSTVTSILEQPATATFNNCNFYCADIFRSQCKKRKVSSDNFNSETDSNLSIEFSFSRISEQNSTSDHRPIFESQREITSIWGLKTERKQSKKMYPKKGPRNSGSKLEVKNVAQPEPSINSNTKSYFQFDKKSNDSIFLPPPKEFAESDLEEVIEGRNKSESFLTDDTSVFSIIEDSEPEYPSERFDYYCSKNFWETPTMVKLTLIDSALISEECTKQHVDPDYDQMRSLCCSQSSPELRANEATGPQPLSSISTSKILNFELVGSDGILNEANLAVTIAPKLDDAPMSSLLCKCEPDFEIGNPNQNYLIMPVYCCSNQAALQKVCTRKCDMSGYGLAFKKFKNPCGNNCTDSDCKVKTTMPCSCCCKGKTNRKRKSRVAFIPVYRRKACRDEERPRVCTQAEAFQQCLQVTPLYTQISAGIPYCPNSCKCGNIPSDTGLKSRPCCRPVDPCCNLNQITVTQSRTILQIPTQNNCCEAPNSCIPLLIKPDIQCGTKSKCSILTFQEAGAYINNFCIRKRSRLPVKCPQKDRNNNNCIKSCRPNAQCKPTPSCRPPSPGCIRCNPPTSITITQQPDSCSQVCITGCNPAPPVCLRNGSQQQCCPQSTCKPVTVCISNTACPRQCPSVPSACRLQCTQSRPLCAPQCPARNSQAPTCAPPPCSQCSPTRSVSNRIACVPTCEPTACAIRCAPTCQPSCAPTCQPSRALTCQRACEPTCAPTCNRTCKPTCAPTCQPTCAPTCQPTCAPTCLSTCQSTCAQNFQPTCAQNCQPSCAPNCRPICQLSCTPCCQPTCALTCQSTCQPTCAPTCQPTCTSTCQRTCSPTCQPTCAQTCQPTCPPNCRPICQLSCTPCCQPTCAPTCQSTCDQNCRPAGQLSCTPCCQPTCQTNCVPNCQSVCTPTCPPVTAYGQPNSQSVCCQPVVPQCHQPICAPSRPQLMCCPICPPRPTLERRKRKLESPPERAPPPRPPPPVFNNPSTDSPPRKVQFHPPESSKPPKQQLPPPTQTPDDPPEFPVIPSRSSSPPTGTMPPPPDIPEIDIPTLPPFIPPVYETPRFSVRVPDPPELKTFTFEMPEVPQVDFPEFKPRESYPPKLDPPDFNFNFTPLDLNMNSLPEPRNTSWQATPTKFPSLRASIPPVTVPDMSTPPRLPSIDLDPPTFENSYEPTDVEMKVPSIDFHSLPNISHELPPPTSPLTGTVGPPSFTFEVPKLSIPEVQPPKKSSAPEWPPVKTPPGLSLKSYSSPPPFEIPKLPSIPKEPSLPKLPSQPKEPSLPKLPSQPKEPSLPKLPSQPKEPSLPKLPSQPKEPSLPKPKLPSLNVEESPDPKLSQEDFPDPEVPRVSIPFKTNEPDFRNPHLSSGPTIPMFSRPSFNFPSQPSPTPSLPPPSTVSTQYHPRRSTKRRSSKKPSRPSKFYASFPPASKSPSPSLPSSPRSSISSPPQPRTSSPTPCDCEQVCVISCCCSPSQSCCKMPERNPWTSVCCPKLPPRRPRKLLCRPSCKTMIISLRKDCQTSPIFSKCCLAPRCQEVIQCCPPCPPPNNTANTCSNILANDVIPVLAQVLADMMVPRPSEAGELLGNVMTTKSLHPDRVTSSQPPPCLPDCNDKFQISGYRQHCQQPQSFSITLAPYKSTCKRRVTGCRKYC